MWTGRLLCEYVDSGKIGSFITLTYDDLNEPKSGVSKDVLQKFNKRCRKLQQYRYYAVGEYGGKTGRPHYHLIMFGVNYDDSPLFKPLEMRCMSANYVKCMCWSKGFVSAGDVTPATAGYICGYVNSKMDLEKRKVMEAGRNPTFSLMSLKPALGSRFMAENRDKIVRDGMIKVCGQEFGYPRYFIDNYMTDTEKVDYVIKCIKENREVDEALYSNYLAEAGIRYIARSDYRHSFNDNLRRTMRK